VIADNVSLPLFFLESLIDKASARTGRRLRATVQVKTIDQGAIPGFFAIRQFTVAASGFQGVVMSAEATP
jgi:hypothetical protein